MTDESSNIGIGLAPYAKAAKRGPHQVFEMMVRKTRRKTRLRALFEIEQAKIAEALPALNAGEIEQLKAMLATDGTRKAAEYFGQGIVGTVWRDETISESTPKAKWAWYCSIDDYRTFLAPVPAKVDGEEAA